MRIVYPDPVILKGLDHGSVWVFVQSMQWVLVCLVMISAAFHMIGMLLWVNAQKVVLAKKQRTVLSTTLSLARLLRKKSSAIVPNDVSR